MNEKIIQCLTVFSLFVFQVSHPGAQPLPVLQAIDLSQNAFTGLIENGDLEQTQGSRFVGVNSYQNGYVAKAGEGRLNSYAAYCDNTNGQRGYGLNWSITLNQSSHSRSAYPPGAGRKT